MPTQNLSLSQKVTLTARFSDASGTDRDGLAKWATDDGGRVVELAPVAAKADAKTATPGSTGANASDLSVSVDVIPLSAGTSNITATDPESGRSVTFTVVVVSADVTKVAINADAPVALEPGKVEEIRKARAERNAKIAEKRTELARLEAGKDVKPVDVNSPATTPVEKSAPLVTDPTKPAIAP